MKLQDIFEDDGTLDDGVGDDATFNDQVAAKTINSAQAPDEDRGSGRVRRNGKNGKLAARIASAARTAAKEADPENDESLAPEASGSPRNIQ